MRWILGTMMVVLAVGCTDAEGGGGDPGTGDVGADVGIGNDATDDAHDASDVPPDASGRGPMVKLVGAEYAACGLHEDGRIQCWGTGRRGLFDVPDGTFTDIDVANGHACAVATDGTMVCWGDAESQSAQAPEGTFTAVSVGSWLSCGLRADGDIQCWSGRETRHERTTPGPFVALVCDEHGVCGLTPEGDVECEDGPTPGSTGVSPDLGDMQTIAAGGSSMYCGLRHDGGIVCWSTSRWSDPLPAPEGTFADVALTSRYGCARRTDGELVCFGDVPDLLADDLERSGLAGDNLIAGIGWMCAIDDGAVRCAGHAELGATLVPTARPTKITLTESGLCAHREDQTADCVGLTNLREPLFRRSYDGPLLDLAAGEGQVCWVDAAGVLSCDGEEAVPALLEGKPGFTAVVANSVACGLDESGAAQCWGPNSEEPYIKEGPFEVLLETGGFCGLAADGQATCWARFGARRFEEELEGSYVQIAVGKTHVCGLRESGALECWANGRDQVGQTDVPEGVEFLAVGAGDLHTCGVTLDGLLCWGARTVPMVPAVDVAVKGSLTCAVQPDGGVWCDWFRGGLRVMAAQ